MPSQTEIAVLAAAAGIFLLMVSNIRAADVRLAWDPPPTTPGAPSGGPAGYKLYYGWASQLNTSVIDVGNRTTYTIWGLKAGQEYFFSVVAYDEELNESPLSEEVSTIAGSHAADRDGDGLLDTEETAIYGTDPLAADTDGDGLDDYQEVSLWGKAWSADDDDDGMINLLDPDADDDGFLDGLEYAQGSDPGDSSSTPAPVSRFWTNYEVTLTMRTDDKGAAGVLFRYQDTDNYYRFSWQADGALGQLVRRYNGVFTLLTENTFPYIPGRAYQVDIVADGAMLEVSIDDSVILSTADPKLKEGSIGMYTWFSDGTSFDDILVQDLDTEEVLLWDDFEGDDFASWTITDEGTLMGPSNWSLTGGVATQSSKIHSELTKPADISCFGSYALYTR